MDLTVISQVVQGFGRLLLLVILLWFGTAAAKLPAHLSFRHILPEQVAAIGYITAIEQDSAGFMWFGGANGLARYDGYTLQIFRQDNNQPGTLASSYVNDLMIARDGTLWVATRGGLHHFDHATNTFINHRPADHYSQVANVDDVNSLVEDQDGNFWLGTRGGLFHFERQSNNFTRHSLDDETETQTDSIIWQVVPDQDGFLWLGHHTRGVSRYDPARKEYQHYPHDPLSTSGPTFPDVRKLYVDSQNILWVGTYGGGLNRFDRATNQFEFIEHDAAEKSAIVWAVNEDREGNLWVGDGSAVYFRAPDSEKFSRFTHEENEPTSLGNYVINHIFEDQAGDIWLGFYPAGIDMVDRQASVFRNYRYRSEDTNTVADGGVLSAFEDAIGNIWVGAGYGLSYFDRTNDRFTRMQHNPDEANSLSGNTILSIVEDSRAQLWLGVWSGGLNQLDLASGKFTHFMPDKNNPASLRGREPWSVIEDSQGDIWIATEEGLNRYQYATNAFTWFSPSLAQLDGDGSLYARVVYEDAQQNIWLGGLRGLFLLDKETGEFTRFHREAARADSLPVDFVLSIYEDSKGNLWVGTDGGGLSLFDRERKKFTTFDSRQGLANGVVASIVEDAQGYIWLGTQKGLSRFDPERKTFRNFDKRHGLNDNLFNRNAPLVTHTGELFFGNSKGFTLFDPSLLSSNTFVPKVVFTDFQIFNKSVTPGSENSPLQKTITYTDTITLDHTQSVFSLEFSALSYHLAEENQYAFRLVGFDQDWQQVGNKRTATYTNLDAGNYTFEVKGANNDGVWSVEPARLHFRILPPLWKTWWAYALYGCVLLLFLYWLTRVSRIKLYYEQKKLEQERLLVKRLTDLDKLKDEFLANTSHELRTPLNGIIGLAESLIDGATGELAPKTRYNLAMIVASGNRLASLVDDILDFAKLKNKGLVLRKKALDLHVLVDIVLTLSQPLVAKKPMHFVNRVPADLPPVYADEDRLMQIFYNLIGNAAKFTDRGSIIISAEADDDVITVHVIDTGIGIPADKLTDIFSSFQQVEGTSDRMQGGTGLGLPITRQLVELHGGEMTVESLFGQGSRFSFTLPLGAMPDHVADSAPTEEANSHSLPAYGHLLTSVDNSVQPVLATATGNQEHILIVDDDPINRQVLVNYLAMRNYRVTEASSGEEAIKLVEQGERVDLVLLDIMMPRLSGYQTCKILRESHPAHELPIILLTARRQMSDLVMGFDVGANDFLTKPIAKEELLARVATHLQLRDVTRNLDSKVAERTEELHLKNEGLREAQLALENAYKKLEEASLSDPLTGLHNRRFLNKFIAADVSIAEREYNDWLTRSVQNPALEIPLQSDLIFMLLDVDHFKAVNDKHGHSAGDRVLEQLGRLLEAALRDSDYLVRWGGEEFLIVVRFTARSEALEMAERIRQTVAACPFDLGNGQVLHKTCSIGFASYPFYARAPAVLSWEQVIDTADRALYAAKNSGRNCWVGLAAGVAADRDAGQLLNPAVYEKIPALIEQGTLVSPASVKDKPLQW